MAKLNSNPTYDPLEAQATTLATATVLLATRNSDYENAKLDAEQKLMLRDQQRAEVENIITVLGAGVEHIAAGDTALVMASGFDVRSPRAPVGPLPAPQNLEVLIADTEGQLIARWNPVFGAKSYLVECKPDAGGGWTAAGVTTKSTLPVSDLESGKKYRLRVRAVGAAGLGPWSGEAVKMAA